VIFGTLRCFLLPNPSNLESRTRANYAFWLNIVFFAFFFHWQLPICESFPNSTFFFLGRFFRVGRKKVVNSLHEFYKLWKSDQALLTTARAGISSVVFRLFALFLFCLWQWGVLPPQVLAPQTGSGDNSIWFWVYRRSYRFARVTVFRNWQRNTDGCRLNGFCFERPTSRVSNGKTNNLELTIGVVDESSNRCLSDVSESSPFSFCRFERWKNQNFEAETFCVLKTSRKSKRTHLSSTSERNLIQL